MPDSNAITRPFSVYAPSVTQLDARRQGFDVVGDIHGCFDELARLLGRAGYRLGAGAARSDAAIDITHPEDRRLVFLGDLTDRGPASDRVLRLAMGGARAGTVHTVMGNHDWKLLRYLLGSPVTIPDGLARTLEQIAPLGDGFAAALRAFLLALPHQVRLRMPESHPRAGDGYLTLVHGAAKTHRQDACDRASFHRSVYGYPTAELDIDGTLTREDWAQGYAGPRTVVHGHIVASRAAETNSVLSIDTGCVFGGRLTMLRLDRLGAPGTLANATLSVSAPRDYSGKARRLPEPGADALPA